MGHLFTFRKNIKTLVLLLFLGVVLITSTGTVIESIKINQVSLNLLKQIARNDDISEITNLSEEDFSGSRNCHFQWLNVMASYYVGDIDRSKIFIMFNCMQEAVDMTNMLFPLDLDLAGAANSLYPQEIAISYWLLDGYEAKDRTLAINYAKDILSQYPTDAVIWRRLGALLWSEAQYKEALHAYIKACEIDDRASNGCYYVAASYCSLGDPLKAIEYFRLSYWPSSWDEADKLETQIASGEIVP